METIKREQKWQQNIEKAKSQNKRNVRGLANIKEGLAGNGNKAINYG